VIFTTAQEKDFSSVDALLRSAFIDLGGGEGEIKLVHDLRKSDAFAGEFVLKDDEILVGHILFSWLKAPEKCLSLAPLSILPSHQNRSLGTKLCQYALSRLEEALKPTASFVLGEPDYYQRFGYSLQAADRFSIPYPKSHFMVRIVDHKKFERLSPVVIYPPEFG